MSNHRALRSFVFAALFVACSTVHAQEDGAATTTTTAPEAAPVQPSTDVKGEIPKELVGRWLAISNVKLLSGQIRPIARTFEIRKDGDRLELVFASDVPGPISEKLDAAAATGKSWTPSDEDLKAVDRGWRAATPDPATTTQIENRLLAADAYPPEFQKDETTKGSQLAIVSKETYAGSQAVRSMYTVYAVRERTPTELKGTSLTMTLAMAFVPLPITLKGDFQAYRIGAPPPSGSLLERLSGLFSGCGRH